MLHVTRTLPILSYKTQQDEREHLLYLPSHSPHSYDREKQEAQLSCSMPDDATVFFNTYRINLEHKDHTLKWQFTRIPLYADCTFPTFQGTDSSSRRGAKGILGNLLKKKPPFNLFDFTTEKQPLTSESTMHVPQVVFLGCAARFGVLEILPEVFTRF